MFTLGTQLTSHLLFPFSFPPSLSLDESKSLRMLPYECSGAAAFRTFGNSDPLSFMFCLFKWGPLPLFP